MKQAPVVAMPPWPWEDSRFAEPAGMDVLETIVWMGETYRDYPDFLRGLLNGGLAMGSPYSLDIQLALQTVKA